MNAEVTWDGLPDLRKLLERAGDDAPKALAAGMYQEAQRMLAVSQTKVPVMDGPLRASATVLPPQIRGPKVTVVFGYGGPAAKYALAVHENPRSGRTGGVSPSGKRYRKWATTGGWKFLEQPVKEMAAGAERRVAADVADWLGRMGR